MLLEKITKVIIDTEEKITVKRVDTKFQGEEYNQIKKVEYHKMLDESPVECSFDYEYIGDGITIEYTAKLGCFSYDFNELYQSYNSMFELYQDLAQSGLCLEEINQCVYCGYIEEKWVEDEDYANHEHKEYLKDIRHAYYS
jgi:hypothetical protein